MPSHPLSSVITVLIAFTETKVMFSFKYIVSFWFCCLYFILTLTSPDMIRWISWHSIYIMLFSCLLGKHENKNMSSGHFSANVCLYGELASFAVLENESKTTFVLGIWPLSQIYIPCLLCYDFIISSDINYPSTNVY